MNTAAEELPSTQVDPVAVTTAALQVAAAQLGVDPSKSQLLRAGENFVYDLGDVVARVTRPGTPTEPAVRTVAVSRWCAEVDVPAVRALDGDQPIVKDGLAVSFWESLGHDAPYGSTVDLAELLGRLHAAPIPAGLHLPQVDPFDRFERRLLVAALPSDDVAFLQSRGADLRDALTHLSFDGPPVVLHGDASVGNVLRDRSGVARLIDLDSACVGPREWDLVLTGLFYERLGWHTKSEYHAFREKYGADILVWPGYPVLADIRELLMVSWLAQKAREAPEFHHELVKRLDQLRRGHARKNWSPY